MVKRYEIDGRDFEVSEDGDWVRYDDHDALVELLTNKLDMFRWALEEIFKCEDSLAGGISSIAGMPHYIARRVLDIENESDTMSLHFAKDARD